MTTITRRLVVLEERRRRQPPPPPPSGFDATRLTSREQGELDELLAVLTPPHYGRRWDLDPLSVEELERLDELTRKGHGLPPAPPYPYMKHRDPGIGVCRCGGDRCGKAVTG